MIKPPTRDATDEERRIIKELVLDYIENGNITSLANAILAAGFRLAVDDADEAYEIGKQEGYESAISDIDAKTGGDGEFVYSTLGGDRHCPDAASMKTRILKRFAAGFRLAPSDADMLAFGASDAACILYPGEDQEKERAAYCAGASTRAELIQARAQGMEAAAKIGEVEPFPTECPPGMSLRSAALVIGGALEAQKDIVKAIRAAISRQSEQEGGR